MTQPVSQSLKLADLRPGDTLIADEAFSCIDPGRACLVHSDDRMGLFVHCCGPEHQRSDYHDKHFLDGQLNDDGEIVGFARPSAEVA